MSKPKRYVNGRWGLDPHESGEWVKWEDYAALAAENEQLNHKLGRLLRAESQWVLVEPNEYARLTAENERLRKAGDEMRNWIICEGYDLHCVDDWNAAKEGDSK